MFLLKYVSERASYIVSCLAAIQVAVVIAQLQRIKSGRRLSSINSSGQYNQG